MIKRYSEFINESNEEINVDNLYKMIINYIVTRLNKETDFIGADPIKESDISYDIDTSDHGKKWYYCTILSERLHCGPFDDDISDHLELLKDAVKGYDVLNNIISDVSSNLSIFTNSMISKNGEEDNTAIKFTVPSNELDDNREALESFFKSTKGIDKFSL